MNEPKDDKDCNTCQHHVQGRSLDDAPTRCWTCSSQSKPNDRLPYWEPISFPLKRQPTAPPAAAPAVDSAEKPSALTIQLAGSHYKDMPIQPVEFCHANGIGFIEGGVIKYVCRWRKKNGIEDLKKARHFLDVLIELEERNTQSLSSL